MSDFVPALISASANLILLFNLFFNSGKNLFHA